MASLDWICNWCANYWGLVPLNGQSRTWMSDVYPDSLQLSSDKRHICTLQYVMVLTCFSCPHQRPYRQMTGSQGRVKSSDIGCVDSNILICSQLDKTFLVVSWSSFIILGDRWGDKAKPSCSIGSHLGILQIGTIGHVDHGKTTLTAAITKAARIAAGCADLSEAGLR